MRRWSPLAGVLLAIGIGGCGGSSSQPYCFTDDGLWSCYASKSTCEAKRDDANRGGGATSLTPCRQAEKLSCFKAPDDFVNRGEYSLCAPTYEICVALRDVLVREGFAVKSQCKASALPTNIYDRAADTRELAEIAAMEAKAFACDAYTSWRRKAHKTCPQSLMELVEFTNKTGDDAVNDPWDRPYRMLCGDQKPKASGVCIGVASNGPDGKPDTVDDVRSWDEDGDE